MARAAPASLQDLDDGQQPRTAGDAAAASSRIFSYTSFEPVTILTMSVDVRSGRGSGGGS